MGTPHYMSPEQVQGRQGRPALRHLLARHHPLRDGDGRAALQRGHHVRGRVRRLQRPPRPLGEIRPDIPALLRRILDALPRHRPRGALPVLPRDPRRPRGGAAGEPGPARPRRRRGLVGRPWAWALAAAGLAGGGWSARRRGARRRATPADRPDRRLREPDRRPRLRRHAGVRRSASPSKARPSSTSYSRGAARRVATQLQPGATRLDESLARLVGRARGDRRRHVGRRSTAPGSGYRVSLRALDAVTGQPIVEETVDARGKDRVLARDHTARRPRSEAPSATRRPSPCSSPPARRSAPARWRRPTSTRSARSAWPPAAGTRPGPHTSARSSSTPTSGAPTPASRSSAATRASDRRPSAGSARPWPASAA